MKHILLNKALTFKKRKDIKPPEKYKYSFILGAWINKIDNTLLIFAKDFKAQSTKKFDVETGEDHKGQ